MDKISYSKNSLRKFGMIMAAAFTVIALIIFWKHRFVSVPVITLAFGFLLSGVVFPVILKPVYFLWMRLALVLAWVNTRLILALMFYLVLTPVGFCMRLFGAGLLDRDFRKKQASYWIKKEALPFDPKVYERQF